MQTPVQPPDALVGTVCAQDPSPDWFPTWGGQFSRSRWMCLLCRCFRIWNKKSRIRQHEVPQWHLKYRFPGPAQARLLGKQVQKPQKRQRKCLHWDHEASTTPNSLIPALTLTCYVNLGEPLNCSSSGPLPENTGSTVLALPACRAVGRSGEKMGCESTSINHPALNKYKMLLLLCHFPCAVNTRPHPCQPRASPAHPQCRASQPASQVCIAPGYPASCLHLSRSVVLVATAVYGNNDSS